MRRRSIAAIAFLSAILLAAVAGNAAGSTTTGGKPDGGSEQDGGAEDSYAQMVEALGPATYRNQLDLMSFKTWMVDQGLLSQRGYAQSVNDAKTRTTALLWGEGLPSPTDEFRLKIESEAKSRSIGVAFQSVPYSQESIQRSSEYLMDPKNRSLIGFSVFYVEGPTPDSPNLTVVGKLGGLDPDALGGRLQELLGIGVPVVVREGEPLVPFVTRSTDQAPFNAGGMMEGSVDSVPGPDCSSGFAVKLGTARYTSTARHCDASAYYAFDDLSSKYGSRIAQDNQTGGVLLSREGFFWMFDGAWNNSSGYHKTVKGLWDVSLGDQMCNSGGATGVHCQLAVNNMSIYWNDGYGSIQTIRIVTDANATVAAGQGDSGGPVFIPSAAGEVFAIGMMQAAGSAQFICGNSRSRFGDALCAKTVLFTSTRVFVQNLRGTLYTG